MAWGTGALEIIDISLVLPLFSFIPHLVAMVTRISKADSRWSSLVVRSTRSSAYMSKRAERYIPYIYPMIYRVYIIPYIYGYDMNTADLREKKTVWGELSV